MARYLAIDLADELKAEAEQLSWSKEGKRPDKGGNEDQTERKRPRLNEDCTKEALEKLRQLERELNEKTDQLNGLITKERLSNDELQGARRELIKGLNDVLKGHHVRIGIKNVGEIDSKVVIRELGKGFSPLYAVKKGVELCSLWQENLKNPQWYPFQIIEDDKGKPLRLLKGDDELLQSLKKEWSQVIHNAVVVGLNDFHEYNPGGCNMVPELWNFKQNLKAALDEVICYILEAVKDVVKMGNTLTINNSRITEHKGSEPSPQCTRYLPISKKTLERNTPGEYVQQEYKKIKKEVPENLLYKKKLLQGIRDEVMKVSLSVLGLYTTVFC